MIWFSFYIINNNYYISIQFNLFSIFLFSNIYILFIIILQNKLYIYAINLSLKNSNILKLVHLFLQFFVNSFIIIKN